MYNTRDWNGNGHHDAGDTYMDYKIAHESLGIRTDEHDIPEYDRNYKGNSKDEQ